MGFLLHPPTLFLGGECVTVRMPILQALYYPQGCFLFCFLFFKLTVSCFHYMKFLLILFLEEYNFTTIISSIFKFSLYGTNTPPLFRYLNYLIKKVFTVFKSCIWLFLEHRGVLKKWSFLLLQARNGYWIQLQIVMPVLSLPCAWFHKQFYWNE